MSKERNHDPETGGKGNPAADQTSSAPPIARTIIEIPESILQEYRRDQKKQHRDNRKNRTIAWLAVVGAWFYATVTTFQYCEMKTATTAAKNSADSSFASVRAWLDIADWSVPEPEWINKGIGKKLANVGKTSALVPEIVEESFFLPTPDSPLPHFTACDDFPQKKTNVGSVIEAGYPWHPIDPFPLTRHYTDAEIAKLREHRSGVILHG